MSEFDPISALMDNTGAGFLSEIDYDKLDGVEPEPRVVEPRVLCDGVDGLLVRCYQLEPSKGTKCFKVAQITRVSRHVSRMSAKALKSNRFCSGEVLESAAPHKSKRRAPVSFAIEIAPAAADLLHNPGSIEYLAELRIAMLDGAISEEERAQLELVRRRLGIEEPQMRAAHTYLLAEEMFAASLDGELGEEESVRLREANRCLGVAGWSPLPTLEAPW